MIAIKDIKYVYFDLDGTLSNSYGLISEETIKAIQLLHDHNIKVGIATGRYAMMFEDVVLKLQVNLPIIGASVSNIGYDIVLSKNKIVYGGSNKGAALKYLDQENLIDLNHTLVFGDSYNDIEMFEVAKYKVAMGNGVPPLKKMANFTTKDVNQEGIAYFINQLLK